MTHHHEPLAFPPFVVQWIPEKNRTTKVVGIIEVSTVRIERQATSLHMVWELYLRPPRLGSTCPAHSHKGSLLMQRDYMLERFESFTRVFQAPYTQCTNRDLVNRIRNSPSSVGLIIPV